MVGKEATNGKSYVQLIGAKDHTPDQNLNVVTQSGLATDGGQSNNAKNSLVEWVGKSTAKSPMFELHKEKETFLQALRDFCDAGASSSKANEKGKGIVSILLRSDPFAGEAQH